MLHQDTGQRVRNFSGGVQTTSPRSGTRRQRTNSGQRPSTWAARLSGAACWLAMASACTSITHQHIHSDEGSMIQPRAGESVTAVLYAYKGMSPDEAHAIEHKVGNCIADALESAVPDVRFIPADEFRAAVFPGLSYAEAPSNPLFLTKLLLDSNFRARLQPLGLRYVILVSGATHQTGAGYGGCFGGYGGAACLVFYVWDRHSNLAALIVDVSTAAAPERVQAEAVGMPGAGIVLWFPVAWPAFTKYAACKEFGHAVAEAIRGAGEDP